MANKYTTSEERLKGLEELQAKTLEWAHEIVDSRDSKGYAGVANSLKSIAETMLKEQSFGEIVKRNRNAADGGYVWYRDDSAPAAEA